MVDALPSSSEENEGSRSRSHDSPLYVVPKNLWEGVAIPVEEEGLAFNADLESIGINVTLDANNKSSASYANIFPPFSNYPPCPPRLPNGFTIPMCQ